VATSYFNSAISLSRLGDYKQAIEYHRKCLEIRINLFGEVHADVENSYYHLGLCYGKLGDDHKNLEYD
jgi:tetratricopeptide (TPR) repeat protein